MTSTAPSIDTTNDGPAMRRAPGKNMGYVILPIGVPAGMTPEEALNDNERYRVVWQILNALRSHDERFDALINKADLGEESGLALTASVATDGPFAGSVGVYRSGDLPVDEAEQRR